MRPTERVANPIEAVDVRELSQQGTDVLRDRVIAQVCILEQVSADQVVEHAPDRDRRGATCPRPVRRDAESHGRGRPQPDVVEPLQ